MTDDNSNLVDIDDNLETFENEFYEIKDEAKSEEVVEDTDADAVATDEDKDAPSGDDDDEAEEASDDDADDDSEDEDEDEEDESEDEDEEKEEKPVNQKKGRNRKSFQERIDELTKRAYEAERRELEIMRRLEEKEAREREVSKEEPLKEQLPPGAPDPHAVGEDGELVYPLGQFDPEYLLAFTKFTLDTEFARRQQEQEQQRAAQELARAQAELQTEWNQKLAKAEEANPEIREDIEELVETFSNIEPAYGEYLAMTIMQCENGPQILEYLSQNIGEAQEIVASGPAAATRSIGKLEALLARKEEKRNAKLVSDAPKPPEQTTRGRKGQRVVRPDTDNLEDFEKIYF